MKRQRVLAIGLDGLELTLAERLIAEGQMPALAALRDRAAWFRLEYGPAQRTGLAWEHVASGRSPEAGRRWAAIEFDPSTYETWQEGARFRPWWADMDRRVVVFDPPYVDLAQAPNTRGIVGWGAHDPGTETAGRPADLMAAFQDRIGVYPAREWTYGLPWASPRRTEAMGEGLVAALRRRAEAARWIGTEAAPDWDLLLVVEGELHGATEGLWHGVDATHPLHGHPSGPAAERALVDLYRALDSFVGELVDAAGDATVVAFTLGGMGSNHSDTASMVLLPELLYRHAFGRPLLEPPPEWTADPAGLPDLGDDEVWSKAILARYPAPGAERAERAARPGRNPLRRLLRRIVRPLRPARSGGRGPSAADAATTARLAEQKAAARKLAWQPAYRYRPHWRRMPAFAIPSYYDGRIRVNLRGRERDGVVAPADYEAKLRELEALIRACRNPRTGEPAVAFFERASTRDPLALGQSEADLLVIWNGVVTALDHPTLGLVGPVPLRRTGGHTGAHGVAFIAGPEIEPGERDIRSAFDVVPTIAALLGTTMPEGTSGKSLL